MTDPAGGPSAGPALAPEGRAAADASPLRDRLVPPMPGSAFWGWAGPLLVTIFGAFLRFDRLSLPHAVLFDETYYVPDAYGILKHGVEINHVKNVNALLVRGNTHFLIGTTGEYVVHPPLGKIMIAVGEWAVRADPVRLAVRGGRVRLAGHLDDGADRPPDDPVDAVRLRGGAAAGPRRAGVRAEPHRDPRHLRHVLGAGSVWPAGDRPGPDQGAAGGGRGSGGPDGTGGPRLGVRWPLVLAGVCLGCACASKWNGVWYIPAFAALVVAWDLGARRAAGFEPRWPGVLRSDGQWLPVWFVIAPAVVYIASWTGWFATSYGYNRNGAALNGGHPTSTIAAWLPTTGRCSTSAWACTRLQPYQSNPLGWLVLARPTSFYSRACRQRPAGGRVHGGGGAGDRHPADLVGRPAWPCWSAWPGGSPAATGAPARSCSRGRGLAPVDLVLLP